MTPNDFEQAQENLEDAYRARRIGRLTFTKRMGALGFSIKACREFLETVDKERADKIGKSQ